MKTVFQKEIVQFFTSPIGYIAIGLFFLLNSLFLWVIEGKYNIPNGGFADLNSFFSLSPWILIFMMAAISMKSFSEEFRSGTIETLLTKPLKVTDIVLGKFLSVWFIGKLSLFPTLVYVYSVSALSLEGQTPDFGIILSSYIGLILLIGVFSAIGVFASILSKNQIGAFLIGLFLMFLFLYGFEGIGNFNLFGSLDLFVQQIGLESHYKNFVKGLILLSDTVYFFSLMILFIVATNEVLKHKLS